jgi:hypothetical protein
MRQNPPTSQPPASSGIKSLFYEIENAQGAAMEYVPFFYVEVRVGFNDVRTGFSSMISLSKALELHSIGSDLSLVEDMVRDIDPQSLKASMPDSARFSNLPDFVDARFMSQMETRFIQYLLNSFKARVYRNFELGVYSNAGESLADFIARCMDLLSEEKRRDLDARYEVFNRRLGQIAQKYLNESAPENFELAKTASQGRDIFSDYLERIAGLFLQSKPTSNPEMDSCQNPRSSLEMEERLLSLKLEAQQAIARLGDSYREKAQSVDEYIIHPNLKDIHLVRSCILWMPVRMA